MKYALRTEVMRHWKADIIENLLQEKVIDPALVHDGFGLIHAFVHCG